MNQILHIFRKDARHHWPEIAGSVALLAVYAWTHSLRWQAHEGVSYLRGFLSNLVEPLVPISWCFLVMRVVQGENLVGDRQFWVTRPYEWKKLLAAKKLFLVVFISAPLLIADVFLLKEAGFQLAPHIGGLLFMQLGMWLILMLPAAAAATVTSTIVQILLLALGTALSVMGFAWLMSVMPNAAVSSASELPGGIQGIVAVASCAVVVVWQYARRKTWIARGVLIGAAVVILLVGIAMPYRTLIEREYPELSGGQSPVEIALGEAPQHEHPVPPDALMGKEDVTVNFPLHVTGMAPGSVIVIDGMQFGITAPQGPPWNSGWQGANTVLWPDREHSEISIGVPAKVMDRVKSASAKVHITMALTVFQERNARTVVAAATDFSVPGIGICSASERQYMNPLQCRAALKEPTFIASIDTASTTCAPGEDKLPAPPGIRIANENWSETSDPAEIGISPVASMSLYFRNWADSSGKYGTPGACPGTPVRFTTPEGVQRLRIEKEFDDVRIGDYASWNVLAVDFSAGTNVHVR